MDAPYAPRTPVRQKLTLAGAILAGLLLAGFGWLWFAPCWAGGCAPVHQLSQFQAEGSQLFDVEGEPFGVLATVNRRVVPLDSMPEHLIQALLAVEDRRFYSHAGVDMRRMAGAITTLFSRDRAEGGSTVTMQLARNLFPDDLPYTERSARRKLMEIRVARQIERSFDKDKILELYLNHIYLGAGAYGVESASLAYFGKPSAELSLHEAALIAGLPKAPSELNPRRNPERALERRNLVLREMAGAGFVSSAEAEEGSEAPLGLARQAASGDEVEGGYFIERVRRELEQRVGPRYYTAGLRIHTTLDSNIQRAAEEELARQLDAVQGGSFGSYRHARYPEARDTVGDRSESSYLQGAVIVLEAQTGAVRALVGGRDFGDSKFDRAVQAVRQPGSAFKPFVYTAALQRYRSPVHQLDDSPLTVRLAGGRTWQPRNYTGDFEGTMTMREALVRSKNVATVRLAQDVGIAAAARVARRHGIESEIPDMPSTALGAAEVTPMELVAAYAPFANGGDRVEPHFVSRIEDRDGRVIWSAEPSRENVLDAATAFVMTSIMRDVVDRGTGAQVRGAGFRGPAAGKTGTTNGNTDVWFVGYTPDLVAGVWIGMDRPAPIVPGASGGTIAAPVWGRVMQRAYAGRGVPAEWSPPSGVGSATVDRATGAVVDEHCPPQGPTYTEYFVGAPPRQFCPQYTPLYAYGDSGWIDYESGEYFDEELWRSGPRSEESTDWPELEEIRRRGGSDTVSRAGETGGVLGEPSTPGTPPAPGTRPAPPAQEPAPPQPPRPDTTPRAEPPPLLGEPVRPGGTGGGGDGGERDDPED
jgi:penicillin-binding protein 1A